MPNFNNEDFHTHCNSYFSENELADFEKITLTRHKEVPQVIRIGNAVFNQSDKNGSTANFPLLIPFKNANGLVISVTQENKADVHRFMQLIALRLIACLSPELVRCRFVDTEHFGASFPFVFGLHEKIIQPENVIAGEHQAGKLLDDFSEIIKTVISRRLTYKFKDLNDYNKNSGATEPFYFLFIADFPSGFNTVAKPVFIR